MISGTLKISLNLDPIRHRAAKHQWSVSNALSLLPVLESWDCLCFKGGQGGLSHDPFSSRSVPQHLCADICLLCFSVSFFWDLNSKNLLEVEAKSTQHGGQNDVGSHLENVSENVPKIFAFSITFQEADVP